MLLLYFRHPGGFYNWTGWSPAQDGQDSFHQRERCEKCQTHPGLSTHSGETYEKYKRSLITNIMIESKHFKVQTCYPCTSMSNEMMPSVVEWIGKWNERESSIKPPEILRKNLLGLEIKRNQPHQTAKRLQRTLSGFFVHIFCTLICLSARFIHKPFIP